MSPGGKETLAELWQNFLEQEAAAGAGAGPAGISGTRGLKSRQGSTSTIVSAAATGAGTGGIPPTPK
jgi:hypothetical protein